MSEVGKLFDRILDYKFKEEWEKINKLKAELSPLEGVSSERLLKYLEPIKEQKGIYDYNVVCDENNDFSDDNYTSVAYTPIKVQPMITFKINITKEGATFSELVEDVVKKQETDKEWNQFLLECDASKMLEHKQVVIQLSDDAAQSYKENVLLNQRLIGYYNTPPIEMTFEEDENHGRVMDYLKDWHKMLQIEESKDDVSPKLAP